MRVHFYTITENGVEYRALADVYQWERVVGYFGVPRSQIKRGAAAGLPSWVEHRRRKANDQETKSTEETKSLAQESQS